MGYVEVVTREQSLRNHPSQTESSPELRPGVDSDALVQHLLAVMAGSEQGFALFDADDRLVFANTQFRRWLGVDAGAFPTWTELVRSGWERGEGTSVETQDFECWLVSARSRRGKLPYRTIETHLETGDWVLTAETTDANGYMLCVVTDVSALSTDRRMLRQERDAAHRAAWTDELTGISNRRYIREQCEQRLGPHKTEDIAIAILDLDHFKAVNDTWGHDVGDVVLKHFAVALQQHASRDDLVGRLGGEEFVVVYFRQIEDDALQMLEGLRQHLESIQPLAEVPTLRYSFSAGVALAGPGESLGQILKRADQALYTAKASGRNRSHFEASMP